MCISWYQETVGIHPFSPASQNSPIFRVVFMFKKICNMTLWWLPLFNNPIRFNENLSNLDTDTESTFSLCIRYKKLK